MISLGYLAAFVDARFSSCCGSLDASLFGSDWVVGEVPDTGCESIVEMPLSVVRSLACVVTGASLRIGLALVGFGGVSFEPWDASTADDVYSSCVLVSGKVSLVEVGLMTVSGGCVCSDAIHLYGRGESIAVRPLEGGVVCVFAPRFASGICLEVCWERPGVTTSLTTRAPTPSAAA